MNEVSIAMKNAVLDPSDDFYAVYLRCLTAWIGGLYIMARLIPTGIIKNESIASRNVWNNGCR